MATLKHVGPLVANDTSTTKAADVLDVNYVNSLLTANMSSSAVTAQIASDLSGYATASYAASSMTGLATPAYVRARAANYVPLTSVGYSNGPLALSISGQISPGVISAASTQRWPLPFYSPAAYQTSVVSAYTPVQLFTMAQADPGYAYRSLCTGVMDGQVLTTDSSSVFPEVLVRQGSTTGPIIAFGYGVAESYQWGAATLGNANTAALGDGTKWAQYYTGTNGGTWATPTANVASWTLPGGSTYTAQTCRCRNLDPLFGSTTGNYQAVSITVGSSLIQTGSGGFFGSASSLASNSIYVRMDVTGTYYVRCEINAGQAALYFALGGSETQIGSTVTSGVTQAVGNTYTLYAGNYSTLTARQFQLYMTSGGVTTLAATWTDTNNASAMSSAYTGWGFGAGTGAYSSFLSPGSNQKPSSISSVVVTDPANIAAGNNSGGITIIPTSLVGQSTQTGATTLYVMLQSSDPSSVSKSVSVSTLKPGLAVVPIPWGP